MAASALPRTGPAPAPQPGRGDPHDGLGHRVCRLCNPGPARPGQRALCGHTTKTHRTFDPDEVQLCTVCEDLLMPHALGHVMTS